MFNRVPSHNTPILFRAIFDSVEAAVVLLATAVPEPRIELDSEGSSVLGDARCERDRFSEPRALRDSPSCRYGSKGSDWFVTGARR